MDSLALPLVIVGVIVAFIGSIRLLICVFTTSILWGVAVIVVPLLMPVFVFLNWHETRGPFINIMIGLGLIGAGLLFGGT